MKVIICSILLIFIYTQVATSLRIVSLDFSDDDVNPNVIPTGDDLTIPSHVKFIEDETKPRYRRYIELEENVETDDVQDEPVLVRNVREADDEQSTPVEDFQEFVNELTEKNHTLKELHQIVNSVHFVHEQVRNTHQKFGQAVYEPRLQEIILAKSKPVVVSEADEVDDEE